MPEVTISIGGRDYEVACQEGEEQYLHAAAKLLDVEATALGAQAARLPESRMLLMAGLMLADKTAGFEEQLRLAEARLGEQEAEMDRLRAAADRPQPAPAAAPSGVPQRDTERVEVPVVPDGLSGDLETLAERAEYLAAQVEEKLSA